MNLDASAIFIAFMCGVIFGANFAPHLTLRSHPHLTEFWQYPENQIINAGAAR